MSSVLQLLQTVIGNIAKIVSKFGPYLVVSHKRQTQSGNCTLVRAEMAQYDSVLNGERP